MSQFTLNNKWSSEVTSRPTFELGELPFFGDLPESGIIPVPMIIENRIGSEIVLLLFDKTPFVSTLAEMRSLALVLKSGLVKTSHGPVIYLLFYSPNAATPYSPYFAHVHIVNPLDAEVMATWRALAQQSHWHLILVDGDRQVKSVDQYENVFGLDETLADHAGAVDDTQPGDFTLATQEFHSKHTLQDLLNMKSSSVTKAAPVTLEIVPGRSIGPFCLGMTIQEINDAMRSLSPEPLTLADLGISASCHDERGNWRSLAGSDRCEQLEIVVVCNEHTILLSGKRVNDVGRDEAWELLESLGSPMSHVYASYGVPEQGISAVRWEIADDGIYCFYVMPPSQPRVAREAQHEAKVFAVSDYQKELQRRIDQFASYLSLMHERSHEIAQGSCFIIFADRKGPSRSSDDELVESKELVLEAISQAFQGMGNTASLSDEAGFTTTPEEGWREDNSQDRFIQFSFEEKWFCLDMPLQTLFRPEAEKILRDRRGFFYLRDRPKFTLKGEDVDGYDPFRKIYLYGDERAAAEDMAYVWFMVWNYPLEWRLYVKAGAFSGKHQWENDLPIE